MPLRAMSQNLFGHNADWPARREVLAAGLRRLRPDVLALQKAVVDDGNDQAAELLGPGYQIARHSGLAADGVGAAMVSRWPLGTVQEVDLHVTGRTADFPWCAAVVAEVLAPPPLGTAAVRPPQAELAVRLRARAGAPGGHHRPLRRGAGRRPRPAGRAGRRLRRPAGFGQYPVPDGRQSLEGTSVRYEDAWEVAHPGKAGHTFSPRDPLVASGEMALERGRRIDYVMVRCGDHGPGLDVAGCDLAFDQPVAGVWASDHFGVLADLELPSRPPGSWA